MAACEGERDSWAGEGDAQFRLEGGGGRAAALLWRRAPEGREVWRH